VLVTFAVPPLADAQNDEEPVSVTVIAGLSGDGHVPVGVNSTVE
jgi:hypothetical protein